MASISESIKEGERLLAEAGIEDSRRDALNLVELATGRDRAFVYAHPEYQLSPEEAARLSGYLHRRASREPLQYIRGFQEFYGLQFEVSPHVLIPRPETEILVEHAIENLKWKNYPRFLDIGTGTGCIPISILRSLPNALAVAVDISDEALSVAERNADRNGVADRLKLISSDLFQNVPPEKFDLIASNPPYVPNDNLAGLQPEVRDHEPQGALTDGGDGLSVIRMIVDEAPGYLAPGGMFLVEIGFGQAEAVRAMANDDLWKDVNFLYDLQAIPRILVAKSR